MAAKNCDYSQTQSQVCKVAGVSEVTLRGLMRILEKVLALLDDAAN